MLDHGGRECSRYSMIPTQLLIITDCYDYSALH